MASKEPKPKKPSELYKENVELNEKYQELNRKLARTGNGTEDVEKSSEEHDVTPKVSFKYNVFLCKNKYF